jgi:hypothetical protein
MNILFSCTFSLSQILQVYLLFFIPSFFQVESVVYRITVPALVEPGQPFYVRVPKQPTWWTSKASQQNTSDQLQPSSSSSPSPSAPVPVLHPPQLSTLVFDESNPAEVREANSSVPDSTPADGAALAPPVGLAPSAPSDYSNGVTSSSISISSSSTGSTSSSISESVSSSSSRSYRRSSGVTAEWSLPRIVGFYAVDGRSIDAKLNALRQWLAEQHVRVLRDCFATTPVGLSLRLHQVLLHLKCATFINVLFHSRFCDYLKVYIFFVFIRC